MCQACKHSMSTERGSFLWLASHALHLTVIAVPRVLYLIHSTSIMLPSLGGTSAKTHIPNHYLPPWSTGWQKWQLNCAKGGGVYHEVTGDFSNLLDRCYEAFLFQCWSNFFIWIRLSSLTGSHSLTMPTLKQGRFCFPCCGRVLPANPSWFRFLDVGVPEELNNHRLGSSSFRGAKQFFLKNSGGFWFICFHSVPHGRNCSAMKYLPRLVLKLGCLSSIYWHLYSF